MSPSAYWSYPHNFPGYDLEMFVYQGPGFNIVEQADVVYIKWVDIVVF